MSPDLILASTSPYRRALLERLRIPFRSVSPDVDESAFKNGCTNPVQLAEQLAELKARAVAHRNPDAIVIGSDQLATIGETVLGKPGTPEAAIAQLEQLVGRTHELVTAVCVIDGRSGRSLRHTDRTQLTMRRLDRDALVRYVATESPTDCAGSYKFESAGVALFEQIATSDPTAIVGLPLLAVVRMLADFGVAIP